MSARATRQSAKQGDLVYTDDPEAITRKKGRLHYTPAPTQSTRRREPAEAEGPPNDDQDTSTEDGDFMDASKIVVQTEAGYVSELNPESGSKQQPVPANSQRMRTIRSSVNTVVRCLTVRKTSLHTSKDTLIRSGFTVVLCAVCNLNCSRICWYIKRPILRKTLSAMFVNSAVAHHTFWHNM